MNTCKENSIFDTKKYHTKINTVKNKLQIITVLSITLLTACGNETENSKSVPQSDKAKITNDISENSNNFEETTMLDVDADTIENVEDTSAVIKKTDEIVSDIEMAADVISKTEEIESDGIINKQADKIKKALHSDNNNQKKNDAQPEEVEVIEVVQKKKIDHLLWDALLKNNVSNSGRVNYKGFKAQKVQLQAYLDELAAKKPGSDWSKNEKLAYWINAYNAFTVKLIIDNYPTSSITKLKGGKPWDDKFIILEETKYSLGQIENDILRKMHEPRIHFAINCASGSCPNLLNKAFVANKISSQLQKVTKSFLSDTSKNDFSGKEIKISELFNWYAKDFNGGDVISYLNKNRTEQLDTNTKIEFLTYDWSLNE